MITGYNTDIKHANRVFHVQTEDNGVANPSIVTLIYVGGEILASKKTSYADRMPLVEKQISGLMEEQHRKMIAAVRLGRFDGPTLPADPLEGIDDAAGPSMLSTTAVPRRTGAVDPKLMQEAPTAPPRPPAAGPMAPPAPKPPAPAPTRGPATTAGSSTAIHPPGGPAPAPPVAAQPPSVLRTQATVPPPPRPKEPTGAIPISDRSLDQVIIDYLQSESSADRLELETAMPDVYGGDTVDTRVFARTAVSRQAVVGAEVVVKVISTVEKPLVVARGKTTGDGSCNLRFKVPDHPTGNSAVIVTVASPQGSDEAKQLVKRRR